MKLPTLWIAAAFATGIGLASREQSSPKMWFASAGIAILVGLILIWQQRAASAWCLALRGVARAWRTSNRSRARRSSC